MVRQGSAAGGDPTTAATSQSEVRIRLADDPTTAAQVVTLQREVWGMSDVDVVPVTQIVTAAHWGGILLVAEDDVGIVGFSYGFLGREGGELLLCSHMVGVVRSQWGRGLGYRLKLAQREEAFRRGLKRIVWTFDPLEARNAYLNLHKLGARSKRYFVNHYGAMDDKLNRGMPTDRLLADWRVGFEPPLAMAAVQPHVVVNPVAPGRGLPAPGPLIREPMGRADTLLAVPTSIGEIKLRDPELASAWRLHVREAFEVVFAAGYVATDIVRGDAEVTYYVLHLEEVA